MPSHPRSSPFSFVGWLLLTIASSTTTALLGAGLLGQMPLRPFFEGPVGPIVFAIALILAANSFYQLLRIMARL